MVNKFRILTLMKEILKNGSQCPAHSFYRNINHTNTHSDDCDYAFEMACSNIRYGPGVTKELGMDVVNFKAKKTLVITDKNVSKIPSFTVALNSLSRSRVLFDVYDDVNIEPTDISVMHAVRYARSKKDQYDLFIAIGGGSVMDTCKVVNLLCADRDAELLDYTNAPIGKGKLITTSLKPMIAIPTTSGTGSETTGIAIFDLTSLKAKVGIAHRNLRPTLGLVDPDHTAYLPRDVACFSGFDVFCHALESYTTLPYYMRSPRPSDPILRPNSQGSNPISDVWALQSLRIMEKYFRRSVNDPLDREARSKMHLASSLAGMGFGTAGVHLCHGMSYPISGLSMKYSPRLDQYKPGNTHKNSLIPHGLSVVVTAPAVFKFTSSICPERHIETAKILDRGLEGRQLSMEDGGLILTDVIRQYMLDLDIPNGLSALGFSDDDIPNLVKGTLPQSRLTKLSPRPVMAEDLHDLFKSSMTVY